MNQKIESVIKKIKCSLLLPGGDYRLFIFGRNPLLSFAELISLFRSAGYTFEAVDISQEGVIVHQKEGWYPGVEGSGMLLKRCVPLCSLEKSTPRDEVDKSVATLLDHIGIEDKFRWAMSSHNEETRKDTRLYTSVLRAVHAYLKERGMKKCMNVKPQLLAERPDLIRREKEAVKEGAHSRAVMPRMLHRKHVLSGGVEIVLWHRENDSVLLRTEQAIDIDDLKYRDLKRPFVRADLGTSAALARTMINLAMQPRGAVLYDPFCGTGTIVQEAIFLGYKARGSDVDPQCVRRARENLLWVAQRYKRDVPLESVFLLDARRIPDALEAESVDAVVTEPYLGPPLKKVPTMRAAQIMIRVASGRYDIYFSSIAHVLRKGGYCVITLPQLVTNEGERFSLDIEPLLLQHGFSVHTEYVPDVLIPFCFVHAPRFQRVEREVIVLKKAAQ